MQVHQQAVVAVWSEVATLLAHVFLQEPVNWRQVAVLVVLTGVAAGQTLAGNRGDASLDLQRFPYTLYEAESVGFIGILVTSVLSKSTTSASKNILSQS